MKLFPLSQENFWVSLFQKSIDGLKENKPFFLSNIDLQIIHNHLIQSFPNLFQRIPVDIYIPNDALKVIEETPEKSVWGLEKTQKLNAFDLVNKHIKFFEQEGFVLYENIYGAMFGTFAYYYRTKGNRIVWFKDGKIEVYAIYVYFDEKGLQVNYEIYDSADIFDPEQKYSELFTHGEDIKSESFNNGEKIITYYDENTNYRKKGDLHFWLKNLSNINKPFEKRYFIEYFLIPPNHHKLSYYSEYLRNLLWGAFFRNYKSFNNEFIKYFYETMHIINVEPSVIQVSSFLENALNDNNVSRDEIFSILKSIKEISLTNLIRLDTIEELSTKISQDTNEIKHCLKNLNSQIEQNREQLRNSKIDYDTFSQNIEILLNKIINQSDLDYARERFLIEHPYTREYFSNENFRKYFNWIFTAEHFYNQFIKYNLDLDASVILIEYSKFVETVLINYVGEKLIRHNVSINNNWKGFDTANRRGKVKPTTLGSWSLLSEGNCPEYENDIKIIFSKSEILQEFLIRKVGSLTKEITELRNGAAHSSIHDIESAIKIRNYLFESNIYAENSFFEYLLIIMQYENES